MHLGDGRHVAGITKVVGVLATRERRAGRGLDRHDARLRPATQRLAQACALAAWQREAAAVAAAPPRTDTEPADTPFHARVWAGEAVLCGDFNTAPDTDAYRVLVEASAGMSAAFVDAWPLAHGPGPRPATFRVHEPGETPIACDFIFVTPGLASTVRGVRLDADTRLSDHQPLVLELGAPPRL